MVIMLTGILTAGGVLILRPLSKRLGELLEVMTRERRLPSAGAEVAQLRERVATLESRLALVEERQDFSEALLHRGEPRPPAALPGRVAEG